jgi:hypothetical protein
MNYENAIANLANAFLTGKSNLSAKELAKIQRLADRHLSVGTRVRSVDRPEVTPSFTGVITDEAEGEVTVETDAPVDLSVNGVTVSTTTLTISVAFVEPESAEQ